MGVIQYSRKNCHYIGAFHSAGLMFSSIPNVQSFRGSSDKEVVGAGINVFDDRTSLFELLEGEVDDMCDPAPTFLKSFKKCVALNFSEDDISCLTSMVVVWSHAVMLIDDAM